MNTAMCLDDKHGPIADGRRLIYTHKNSIARRISVVLLLLYFSAIVDSGSNISGNLGSGLYFTRIFQTLFPFPSLGLVHPNPLKPLSPVDELVYTVFISSDIWMVWTLLAIAYIVMPIPLRVYRTWHRSKCPESETKLEKRERDRILTGMLASLSMLLSIVTYSAQFNLWNYGYEPFLVSVVFSAVLLGVFAWKQESSASASMMQRIGILQHPRRLFYQRRNTIARRITVLLFLFYIPAVVDTGNYIGGDIQTGFFWSIGFALFPFPRIPFIFAEAIIPVPSIEALIYIIFAYQGIWIVWMFLSFLYIALPLVSWGYRSRKRTTLLQDQDVKERIEGIGVVTGSAAFLSILFSIGTYSATSNFSFSEPIMFVFVVVLSAMLAGTLLLPLKIASKMPS